jgi:hypothetical protein
VSATKFHTHTIQRAKLWFCTIYYLLNIYIYSNLEDKPIEIQIKRRKWNWIGHTLHKEAGVIRVEKTALDWNPRDIEEEAGRRERDEGQ